MNSYWERSIGKNQVYDWLIIGGGILGHFCAFEIKEKYPNSSVAILEKDSFGFGATTRNAGFACFGTVGEFLSDSAITSESKALSTLIKRKVGLDILTSRFSKEALGYDACGGYELLGDKDLGVLPNIAHLNKLIEGSIGLKETFVQKENTAFTSRVKASIFNQHEGTIKSNLLMLALKKEASCLGITCITGYEALSLTSTSSGADVLAVSLNKKCSSKAQEDCTLVFKSKQVLVATNALLKELLPESAVEPQRGQVFVSSPLDLKINSSYHYDSGYYYFRTLQELGEKPRLLMGGARNVSFETENTSEIAINEKILSHLTSFTEDILGLKGEVKIDYAWAGLMGFTKEKEPVISLNVRPNISSVFACNGMGIALSPYVARDFAKLI